MEGQETGGCLAVNLGPDWTMYLLTGVPLSPGTAPNSPVSLPESPVTPGTGQWSDECTICYEHAVDTVIYTCGHMCLCYACGLRLKKALHACCPICRRPIKDIIKTYRSS